MSTYHKNAVVRAMGKDNTLEGMWGCGQWAGPEGCFTRAEIMVNLIITLNKPLYIDTCIYLYVCMCMLETGVLVFPLHMTLHSRRLLGAAWVASWTVEFSKTEPLVQKTSHHTALTVYRVISHEFRVFNTSEPHCTTEEH